MDKKNISTFTIYIVIFICFYLTMGYFSIIELIISIIIYSIIIYVLKGIYLKIKNKDYEIFKFYNYKIFFINFIKGVGRIIILFIAIIFTFSYYQNEINPAKMPIYHITNGEKNVVFISMSHIGSQNFYNKVKNKIIEYKKQDYSYFFEGVKPGSEKNSKQFNEALGANFDENTYKYFSKLYGLTHQDNNLFLGHINDKDYNIDIGIDEIIEEYNLLKKEKNITNKYSPAIDINTTITETIDKLNEKQLKTIAYINRSFINFIIKNSEVQGFIQNNFANRELFEIILGKRDKFLAENIINSKENIITTYGLLHFNGVLEILKKSDIKWRVSEIEYLNVLK